MIIENCRNLRWHHGGLHATLGLSVPTPTAPSSESILLGIS